VGPSARHTGRPQRPSARRSNGRTGNLLVQTRNIVNEGQRRQSDRLRDQPGASIYVSFRESPSKTSPNQEGTSKPPAGSSHRRTARHAGDAGAPAIDLRETTRCDMRPAMISHGAVRRTRTTRSGPGNSRRELWCFSSRTANSCAVASDSSPAERPLCLVRQAGPDREEVAPV